jgi:hypothetical protein
MEFVIVAPIIMLLVSMVLQFAHIWTARQITAYAAYCATRAIIAVPPNEQEEAAKKAAELACSWMTLVGLPDAVIAASSRAPTGTKTVHVGRLHGKTDISEDETINEYRNAPIAKEVGIPGWGSIPGSDSAAIRVKDTKVIENGIDKPIAMVTVQFKFPLVLPLAGRMISWAANRDGADGGLAKFDYGHHKTPGGNNPAWAGQEVVMNASGDAEERGEAHDSSSHSDGKFPFITLTETCVLPMPYSTARFPANGYMRALGESKNGVSDLIRGEEL